VKQQRIAASLGFIALAAALVAAPTHFATKTVDIKAGVVIIDSQQVRTNGPAANYAPYVWFNMNNNRLVKPASWNFVNPRAFTVLSDVPKARWDSIAVTVGGTVPNLNAPITKQNAAYWEVLLTAASDTQLSDYDVLLLPAHGFVSLNTSEREKLRRFVDQGGVLWVDSTGNAGPNSSGSVVDGINNLPIPVGLNGSASSQVGIDFTSAVLNYPYPVSFETIVAAETSNRYGMVAVNLSDLGASSIERLLQPLAPDYSRFAVVAQDVYGPKIITARLGDGAVVMTSGGLATSINRTISSSGVYLPNLGAQGNEPTFDKTAQAAARIVANIVSMNSGYDSHAHGSRKANSSSVDLTAPLLKRFDANITLNPGVSNYVPPAVKNGVVVICDDTRVYAYDAYPASDLDGDGNADDGIADFSQGSNQDLLWVSQSMSGPISPPTIVELPAGAIAREQVLVQDADGNVNAFELKPKNANGVIRAETSLAYVYRVDPPNGNAILDTSLPGRGPYAPTFHEGLVYVADSAASDSGRLWVFNPGTGNKIGTSGNEWCIGGSLGTVLHTVGAPATIGYIPIADGSGGVDKVAYVVSRPNSSVPGANSTAGIHSFWIGARGEVPAKTEIVGNQLRVTLRCQKKNLSAYLPTGESSLGIKLTILRSNGDAYSASDMTSLFDGNVFQSSPGVIDFRFANGNTLDLNNTSVRIDYTIDWSTSGVSFNARRGNLFFPDDSNRTRRILGHVAMSPAGTLYAVVSNGVTGGSMFAVREVGQGNFKLVYRYDLYPQHTFTSDQSSTSISYKGIFHDNDPVVTDLVPALNTDFTNMAMVGGPTVRNGVVYCTARGMKLGVVPNAIVLAFKAEVEPARIQTSELSGSFTIMQPDMLRSPDLTSPAVKTTISPSQYRYETRNGVGIIAIDSMMANTNGAMLNAISTSQPVVIRRNGQPDLLVEPDVKGKWSPLLHYMVLTGLSQSSPPIILGDTLYVAGNSVLPSMISPPFGSLRPRGLVYAMDAFINPNDAYLVSDSDKPWQKQVIQLRTSPSFSGNPAIRWPQSIGAANWEDYRVRLLQTTLGSSQNSFGVVGGDGMLFSWGPDGIWGFNRADFVVADEGRIARFDPSGNVLWSSDASITTGPSVDSTAVGSVKRLVRPTRAYPIGNDLLIVDTGADRVVRMDSSGREVRSIDRFRLDPGTTPVGFEAGDPLTLRQPRDVLTYVTYETNPTLSNGQPMELWRHYMIADSGNNRVVELIDRYAVDPATRQVGNVVTDANGDKALGVLIWHSPASVKSKTLGYTSLSRIWVNDASGGHYVFATAMGASMPTRTDLGYDNPTGVSYREDKAGNGGIVIYDGTNTIVINKINVPAIGANVFWNPTTGSFNSAAIPAHERMIGSVTSVTMRNMLIGGQPGVGIMFTDPSGVYEIPLVNGVVGPVRWMLPEGAYKAIRRNSSNVPTGTNPRGLKAYFARRLDSGEVLIVNGYYGYMQNGSDFTGEIIQVDGDIDANPTADGFDFNKVNFGFKSISVRFELPPIQGTKGLSIPVFADRR